MSKKAKFNPEITRVKLNPEQAVLACPCYSNGWDGTGDTHPSKTGCDVTGAKINTNAENTSGAPSS